MEGLPDHLRSRLLQYLAAQDLASLSVAHRRFERELAQSLVFLRTGNRERLLAERRKAQRAAFRQFCKDSRKILDEHGFGH